MLGTNGIRTRKMIETPRDRLTYSPITDRPKLTLPGGARMAVWTIMNVEHWGSTKAQPRTILPPPMGQPLLPDVPNWSVGVSCDNQVTAVNGDCERVTCPV